MDCTHGLNVLGVVFALVTLGSVVVALLGGIIIGYKIRQKDEKP